MADKGWHGESKRHSDAALKAAREAELNDTLRKSVFEEAAPKEKDPKYGRDWELETKGILVVPTPGVKTFIIAEQQKWDVTISPTVPSNFHNRYKKTMLLTGDSPEYIEYKRKNPKWYIIDLYENVSKLLKRHQSEIPRSLIPKIDAIKDKTTYLERNLPGMNPAYYRIAGVGIYMSRGLYETYIVDESFSWDKRFARFDKEYSISEIGSEYTEKLLKRYSNRGFIEKFYESISSMIHTYQVFLLGREGLQAYYETADDRALVDAISHGALMDEEGYIVDPVTGTKL